MLPLALFRRPAFTGVQLAAFAISASVFALFLYLDALPAELPRLLAAAGRAALPADHAWRLLLSRRSRARCCRGCRPGLLMSGGLALAGVGPAADVRDRRRLRVDHAARRLPGPGRRCRPAQPGDRGCRAQRGARRSGVAWPPGSTTRSARSASRSASRSGARSSSAQGAAKVSRPDGRHSHGEWAAIRVSSSRPPPRAACTRPWLRCRSRRQPAVEHAAREGFLAGFNDVLTLGRLVCFAGRRPGALAGSRARDRARAGGAGVPARVRGDAAGRRRLGPASSTQTKRPPAGAASSRREGISVSRPWCRRGRSRSPSCCRPSRLPSALRSCCRRR